MIGPCENQQCPADGCLPRSLCESTTPSSMIRPRRPRPAGLLSPQLKSALADPHGHARRHARDPRPAARDGDLEVGAADAGPTFFVRHGEARAARGPHVEGRVAPHAHHTPCRPKLIGTRRPSGRAWTGPLPKAGRPAFRRRARGGGAAAGALIAARISERSPGATARGCGRQHPSPREGPRAVVPLERGPSKRAPERRRLAGPPQALGARRRADDARARREGQGVLQDRVRQRVEEARLFHLVVVVVLRPSRASSRRRGSRRPMRANLVRGALGRDSSDLFVEVTLRCSGETSRRRRRVQSGLRAAAYAVSPVSIVSVASEDAIEQ